MKTAGATVLAVLTDVSRGSDVEALAQKTLSSFGAVHLLCNNAGVDGPEKCIWESTLADWKWVMGVNLWGVIHGIRVFVPIMLSQETDCHIINTASIAGLTSFPRLGVYTVTKHGVVSLSETLSHELALKKAKVKVSVLCPSWVNTRIMASARNRPVDFQNEPADELLTPEQAKEVESDRKAVEEGMSPDQMADHVFNAIREEKFYILTYPEPKEPVRTRMESILQERNPTVRRSG